jgi:hypothetical protein
MLNSNYSTLMQQSTALQDAVIQVWRGNAYYIHKHAFAELVHVGSTATVDWCHKVLARCAVAVTTMSAMY